MSSQTSLKSAPGTIAKLPRNTVSATGLLRVASRLYGVQYGVSQPSDLELHLPCTACNIV
eukprot:CAMPEP_0195099206 /NCGR_PEP_ID=MMETSP0448-20130528/58138_1 /TAXON_ID=66468 /ORGANISM="Heterocapsa triquestra, Strain CCMP 448" /LENGTH=59 /DNA_ID=CAMNT_0040134049 /DNA_START=16 /DNA_END=195 /DNA_ORIENTATION=+